MYEEVTDPDKTCAGLFQAGWLHWNDSLSCSYGISRHRADFYLLLDLSCVYLGKGLLICSKKGKGGNTEESSVFDESKKKYHFSTVSTESSANIPLLKAQF